MHINKREAIVTKRDSWVMGAVLAGLTVLAAPVQAQSELVVNGGFEQRSFNGWVQTGNFDYTDVMCGAGAYGGECAAIFGSAAGGSIGQTINFGAAGVAYELSFAVQTDGGQSNLSVLFGGQTLLALDSPAADDFKLYTYSGFSTGENMTLSFSFSSPISTLYLDSVSVTAVPEPQTVALMFAGLAAVGFAARRASKKG